MIDNKQLNELRDELKERRLIFNNTDFADRIEKNRSYLSEALNGRRAITEQFVLSIADSFPIVSRHWLLTGEGEMLNTEAQEPTTRRNLIPIYESVETIGGTNIVADVDTSHDSRKVEKIDVGNLFWGATSIIRHSGESMIEYRSGTMLAVMRITDLRNIATGKNYVVETDDYRVTKQLVDADDEYFIAYSTNTETRPDGSLVYAPFKIYKSLIRHIDLVIGSVNIER